MLDEEQWDLTLGSRGCDVRVEGVADLGNGEWLGAHWQAGDKVTCTADSEV